MIIFLSFFIHLFVLLFFLLFYREQKEAMKSQVTDTKKKTVNLVDPKRAQNAGIALARLRVPYSEVRDRIIEMDDKAYTADQYTSLMVRSNIINIKYTID